MKVDEHKTMNERQHIALTEAQIIAAEKGEIQLETRDGRKVVQFVWFREPCKQTDSNVLYSVLEDGEICFYSISGKRRGFDASTIDLFVSEPEVIEPKPAEPKPLYEVGEIIEVKAIDSEKWKDAEFIAMSRNYCLIWMNDIVYRYSSGHHRKKQTEKTVTLENKVMTVKEAFKYLTNIQ